MSSTEPLLHVKNLVAGFPTKRGARRVVDGVSFDLHAGSHVALVGPSGSGKTALALSIFGILPSLCGQIESGQVVFDGLELRAPTLAHGQPYHGGRIAMVFQDPGLSLVSSTRVGQQMVEVVRSRQRVSAAEARGIGMQWLHSLGIASPALSMDSYPHELSMGTCRRVMMAMALSCEPELLIADDPTLGLDSMVQSHVLDVVRKASAKRNMAVLHLAHDLGVVAEFADRILVMCRGQLVESGTVEEVFRNPQHPKTRELLGRVGPQDPATQDPGPQDLAGKDKGAPNG